MLAKGWITTIVEYSQKVNYESHTFLELYSCEKTILNLIEKAKKGFMILSTEYIQIMNFIAAHLYVANPQSRVGAINRLTLQQCRSLCDEGRLECSDFKTWETYEAQFITACPATIKFDHELLFFLIILIDIWSRI